MNFIELRHNDKSYINHRQILKILKDHEFYWLIDSEFSDAIIEIKKNTIIWHDGVFMSGNWHYGIFKKGSFYGNWENGIFESGYFNGNWISGVNLTKNNQ